MTSVPQQKGLVEQHAADILSDFSLTSSFGNGSSERVPLVQVVYLHTPSGSLVAGDTFTNTGQPPALGLPPPRMSAPISMCFIS